jgi:hypothetical protein
MFVSLILLNKQCWTLVFANDHTFDDVSLGFSLKNAQFQDRFKILTFQDKFFSDFQTGGRPAYGILEFRSWSLSEFTD